MDRVSPNPFTRDDTFLGICQALGDDFGFNPLWLRLAFAGAMFYSPVAALGTYAALGLIVLASRLVAPNPRIAKVSAEDSMIEEASPAPLHADNETVAEFLAVAA